MGTILEVKDLKVSYHTYAGEVQSVRGISFRVEEGETVAIVGEEVCENIRTLMGDMGVETDVAHSLEEVCSCLERDPDGYHVILLCGNVADTGVLQAAGRIREKAGKALPILFLADHEEEETEDVLRMENTGILMKPFFASAFKAKIEEMQAGAKSTGEPEETGSNLEGLRFLAAEDNEINAEILREILAFENAECVIVENGQLAVERFEESEKGEFDAVLMDVQMPVMNGYDATRAIRSLPRADARTIPIIAMTANAFAEDEKEALDAGMDVHLAKPIDIELLKQVIRQYTKNK